MSVEGNILIRLGRDDSGGVSVASRRPLQICRLLEQQPPLQALQKLPLMFSLCGRSQSLAGTLALAAAEDRQLSSDTSLPALLEMLQESLWRLLIDLPRVTDFPQNIAALALVRRLLDDYPALGSSERQQRLKQITDLIGEHLTGMPLAVWLRLDLSGLRGWLKAGTGIRPQLQKVVEIVGKGEVGDHQTAQMSDDLIDPVCRALAGRMKTCDQIVRRPDWQGQPLQTGSWCYHRQHTLLAALVEAGCHPVLIRLLARVADIADILERLSGTGGDGADRPARWGGGALSDGCGYGWVKTARGLLFHYLQLRRGELIRYRIVAPTEWNFHPGGVMAESLAGWRSAPTPLTQWVAVQVLSLDPCVNYQLEICDA